MAIADECLLEEFNLPTLQTSVVELESEVENYGRARPNTACGVNNITFKHPQVNAVPNSNSTQEEEVRTHGALLRNEVVIPPLAQ